MAATSFLYVPCVFLFRFNLAAIFFFLFLIINIFFLPQNIDKQVQELNNYDTIISLIEIVIKDGKRKIKRLKDGDVFE